jgi:hypothetical protein
VRVVLEALADVGLDDPERVARPATDPGGGLPGEVGPDRLAIAVKEASVETATPISIRSPSQAGYQQGDSNGRAEGALELATNPAERRFREGHLSDATGSCRKAGSDYPRDVMTPARMLEF